jgi:hypothetical protein
MQNIFNFVKLINFVNFENKVQKSSQDRLTLM